MFKKMIYCTIGFSLLLAVSCTSNTSPDKDYILIKNQTNGQAFLTLNADNTVTVEALTDYKWYYEEEAKADNIDSLSFFYVGDYLLPNERVVNISKDETASTQLIADCSRLKIDNQTNALVDASIMKNGEQIDLLHVQANESMYYKVEQTETQDSLTVVYDGRYVFSNAMTTETVIGETAMCPVIPDAGSLEVFNTSAYTIYGVYMQPNGMGDMGDNLINMMFGYGDYRIIKMHPQSGTVFIKIGTDNYLQYYDSVISNNTTLTINVQ